MQKHVKRWGREQISMLACPPRTECFLWASGVSRRKQLGLSFVETTKQEQAWPSYHSSLRVVTWSSFKWTMLFELRQLGNWDHFDGGHNTPSEKWRHMSSASGHNATCFATCNMHTDLTHWRCPMKCWCHLFWNLFVSNVFPSHLNDCSFTHYRATAGPGWNHKLEPGHDEKDWRREPPCNQTKRLQATLTLERPRKLMQWWGLLEWVIEIVVQHIDIDEVLQGKTTQLIQGKILIPPWCSSQWHFNHCRSLGPDSWTRDAGARPGENHGAYCEGATPSKRASTNASTQPSTESKPVMVWEVNLLLLNHRISIYNSCTIIHLQEGRTKGLCLAEPSELDQQGTAFSRMPSNFSSFLSCFLLPLQSSSNTLASRATISTARQSETRGTLHEAGTDSAASPVLILCPRYFLAVSFNFSSLQQHCTINKTSTWSLYLKYSLDTQGAKGGYQLIKQTLRQFWHMHPQNQLLIKKRGSIYALLVKCHKLLSQNFADKRRRCRPQASSPRFPGSWWLAPPARSSPQREASGSLEGHRLLSQVVAWKHLVTSRQSERKKT